MELEVPKRRNLTVCVLVMDPPVYSLGYPLAWMRDN